MAGHSHPFFGSHAVRGAASPGADPVRALRKLLRSLDRVGDGALTKQDVLYAHKVGRGQGQAQGG